MIRIARAYLDSSALFSGLWSAEGGARMILKLGEAEAVQIMISSQVLTEVEGALRKKAPGTLGALALILERSNAQILPNPSKELIKVCEKLVDHPGDARVLASVWDVEIDFFVTLDRKHIIENQALKKGAPFLIGTRGDFLDWFRGRLTRTVS